MIETNTTLQAADDTFHDILAKATMFTHHLAGGSPQLAYALASSVAERFRSINHYRNTVNLIAAEREEAKDDGAEAAHD